MSRGVISLAILSLLGCARADCHTTAASLARIQATWCPTDCKPFHDTAFYLTCLTDCAADLTLIAPKCS